MAFIFVFKLPFPHSIQSPYFQPTLNLKRYKIKHFIWKTFISQFLIFLNLYIHIKFCLDFDPYLGISRYIFRICSRISEIQNFQTLYSRFEFGFPSVPLRVLWREKQEITLLNCGRVDCLHFYTRVLAKANKHSQADSS
jgi:hypothetical protein